MYTVASTTITMSLMVRMILLILLLQSTLLESFHLTSPLAVVHHTSTRGRGKNNLFSLQMVGENNNKKKDQTALPTFFGMTLLGGKNDANVNGAININGATTNNNNNNNNSNNNENNDNGKTEKKSTKSKVWNTTIFPAKEFGKDQQSLPLFLGVKSTTGTSASSGSSPADATTSAGISTSADDIQTSFSTMIQKEIYTQIVAAMIGGFTGICIAGFKLSIEGIREFCYGGSLNFISPQDEIVPYYIVPVLGAVGVTFLSLTGDFSPGLKGVVKEVDAYSSSIENDKVEQTSSPWTLRPVRKALAAIVTLGTGNSLGPEGPGVEIGAAISRVGMSIWPFERSFMDMDGKMMAGMEKNDQKTSDKNGFIATTDDSLVERITRNRLLLACGAAAGVSSGFNAPLSGVFFALEVVQSSLPMLKVPLTSTSFVSSSSSVNNNDNKLVALEPKSLSANSGSIAAILISSVVAALVARVILGDELALRVLTYDISTPLSELPLYILLGSFCGVVSVAFSQAAKFFKALFEGNAGPKIVQDTFGALPAPLLPIIGGVVSGGVGYFYPQILFFGYETLNGLLQNDNLPTVVLLSLLLAKITTTAVSAGSGLVGGILAPSLFLGGMTGAIFHNVVCQTFISLSIQETLVGPSGTIFDLAGVPIYSSVGAASVLAAIFRAPLTASLLLFEITRNYDILLPILASAGIATLFSDILENNIESKS